MIIDSFPPSPALSACDSLADIDDLDAFLESKGPLSHFATPPLLAKAVADVQTIEVFDDSDDEYDDYDVDYAHTATLFAGETCNGAIPTACEVDLVYDMLIRAQLPAELLALSYNILRRHATLKSFDSCYAADLLTVSAFALAVTYTSDHPPRSSWWSCFVCNDLWNAADIDRMMLSMLVTLDWSLHSLSSPQAMDRAMSHLVPPKSLPLMTPQKYIEEPQFPPIKLPLNTITIENTSQCWLHDQLTPEDILPWTPMEEAQNKWLPLL
ncbi:hypothetical protein LTR36_007359 [Oleoguttula mirabilis]|uniref:Cyclin N-terminal domain-containing protein n=1 Tax=Oleoguttula mirabilis TaxID=1507867 RepID=A0AAV9J9N0_9PEZI|nr:hypothetical protein LTR36_007359 [Oleoguttula mirabilis]